MDETAIELRGIYKRFGDLEVIKGIDLTARRGEVVALIGTSGSGKSTLLRCVNLLERPDAGEILFNGESIDLRAGRDGTLRPAHHEQITRVRAGIGFVFQNFNLWPHMSVLENVIEAPIHVSGLSRRQAVAEAEHLLEKVGLGDKKDAYPAFLSGGQQQRAAIARALCMEPQALLFDEPTSALDPELEQEVVRVIKDLAAEGRTMMIVTHDMRMAADMSSHVIFLHQGLIEEEGPPDALFGAPRSARLRQFLSHSAPA